jgi:ElaB/YqjD/DUF883 family membrane-anchored ribosome-binding protein
MLLGICFAGLLAKYIYSLASDIHSMAEKIKSLDAAILSEKGNPLAQYSALMAINDEIDELRKDTEKHIAQAERHYQTLEDIDAEEKYKNCDIDKCVHLQKIINAINGVLMRFDQFDDKADTARSATGNSLDDIREEMKGLSDTVSIQTKEMIHVLTEVLISKGGANK